MAFTPNGFQDRRLKPYSTNPTYRRDLSKIRTCEVVTPTRLAGEHHKPLGHQVIRAPGWSRTIGVSYVADLQSAIFATGYTDAWCKQMRIETGLLYFCTTTVLPLDVEWPGVEPGTQSSFEVSDLCNAVCKGILLHIVVLVNTKVVKILDKIIASLYNVYVSEERSHSWRIRGTSQNSEGRKT